MNTAELLRLTLIPYEREDGREVAVTVSTGLLRGALREIECRPRSLGHVLGFWNDDNLIGLNR